MSLSDDPEDFHFEYFHPRGDSDVWDLQTLKISITYDSEIIKEVMSQLTRMVVTEVEDHSTLKD